jgi:hypothetical protein
MQGRLQRWAYVTFKVLHLSDTLSKAAQRLLKALYDPPVARYEPFTHSPRGKAKHKLMAATKAITADAGEVGEVYPDDLGARVFKDAVGAITAGAE